MSRRTFILLLAALALALLMGVYAPIRVGFGLMAACVLPGYMLVAVLFVREPLKRPLHITMSLVFSVFIMQAGGILLNWARVPLTPQNWTIYLVGITVVFMLVVRVRRHPFAPTPWPRLHINIGSAVLLVIAILLAFSAYTIARLGETLYANPGFTQLYARYVSGGIEVSAVSFENAPITYRLYVITNGRELVSEEFELAPTQQWQKVISTRTIYQISVELYLAERPGEAYRRLRLNPPEN